MTRVPGIHGHGVVASGVAGSLGLSPVFFLPLGFLGTVFCSLIGIHVHGLKSVFFLGGASA